MRVVRPAARVLGRVVLPGDKSISHRYAILGAIAQGETRLRHAAPGQDVCSTLNCLKQLGVSIETEKRGITIRGVGLHGLSPPDEPLNAGNSGTTLRLLSGVLAAQSFGCEITGDDSLCGRPMKRIIDPLRQMGAILRPTPGNCAPIHFQPARIRGIEFHPPIPSAQVKSCILLAGLYGEGSTRVCEDVATRDHTELALASFGADIRVSSGGIEIHSGKELQGVDFSLPGDLSAAVFWIIAALILPGSEILIEGVGLNPTRSAVLGLLSGWGADLTVSLPQEVDGEVSGAIRVRHSPSLGADGVLEISRNFMPLVIDEIPALAILGCRAPHGLRIHGAEELRVKESDRLHALAENLYQMGALVEEYPDGLEISGNQALHGAVIDSFGDHRIAMAFSVAALAAKGPSQILNPDCIAISYPQFFETLGSLSRQ